ncbi:hypothetical protein F2Q68_00034837 [Brassica cretica]|uniref:Uncharacterized protein n=1 Tax=Brassica cretica TaxID=69181 RepID=A0A8S9GYC0_BRACR|nr:hypothetical protein F2Q68_00034837 [Brassica cretica]
MPENKPKCLLTAQDNKENAEEYSDGDIERASPPKYKNAEIWTAITQLVHHGMLIVPIGYTFGAGMFKMDSIHGGSPYGAGVFAGDGSIEATETELALAEPQ